MEYINTIADIIFLLAILYALHKMKNKSKEFEEQEINIQLESNRIQKEIIRYEALRKHYSEHIMMDINDGSLEDIMSVAALQDKQQEAIEAEEYERAGQIQDEINLILKENENGEKNGIRS